MRLKHLFWKQSITLPITSEMLSSIFTKQTIGLLSTLNVSIDNKCIELNGIVRRKFTTVEFLMKLKPTQIRGRKIIFTITHLTSLDQYWIKKELFHRPPILLYNKGYVMMDLNTIEMVKSVPDGSIQDIMLWDKKIWLKIG